MYTPQSVPPHYSIMSFFLPFLILMYFNVFKKMRDRHEYLRERARRQLLLHRVRGNVAAGVRQRNRGKASSSINFMNMPDAQFKLHFRFTKDGVRRITNMLLPFLSRQNEKGSPLSPFNQVAIALLQLSGACFQRTTGLAAGGISQNCARVTTKAVVHALFALRTEWIKFPAPADRDATAMKMLEDYGLPNFFAGVDGCHVRFQIHPRGCPPGQIIQNYWCRKQFYSLNVQFISNHKFIYSVDAQWFGSAHDSRVFKRSIGKVIVEQIESSSGHLIAGDSAYPLSKSLIKPFSAPTTRTEGRFNGKLSGLRTVMTENVYGRLKARFPILREMRHHLVYSQRIVVACSILHNIAESLNDEIDDVTPDDPLRRPFDEPAQTPPRRRPVLEHVNVDGAGNRRLRDGQRVRFEMLRQFAEANQLPPPNRMR